MASKLDTNVVSTIIQDLVKQVDHCRYDIPENIPEKAAINTSRVIRTASGAWSDYAPLLREFIQNVIDHLGLYNGATGGTAPGVTCRKSEDGNSWTFAVGDTKLAVFSVVDQDTVSMEQWFTFPLHPRVLETGVIDDSKCGADKAGGYGDGFKTGISTLLSFPGSEARWVMKADGHHMTWDFLREKRERVGKIREGECLKVEITRGIVSIEDENYSMSKL